MLLFLLRALVLISFMLSTLGCEYKDEAQHRQQHANGGVHAAAISADGQFSIIASPAHQHIALWDLKQQSLRYEWQHQNNQAHNTVAVAFSGDSQYAISADKHSLVLWQIANGKALSYLQMPNRILELALNYNGRYALVTMVNGQAKYIDTMTAETYVEFEQPGEMTAMALATNGLFALTANDKGHAYLWDLQRSKLLHEWQQQQPINHVAISNNNRFALTSEHRGRSTLWDISSGRALGTLGTTPRTVTAMSFSADERYIAIATSDQTLELWSTQDLSQVHAWSTAKNKSWKPSRHWIKAINILAEKNMLQTFVHDKTAKVIV